MPAFEIRLASEADLSTLITLFEQTVLTYGPQYYTPEQVAAWASFASETDRFRHFILDATTFIALDSEGIAGFGGIAPDGHITALYVRQPRRGVGSALVQEILAWACDRNIPRLYAEASHFSLGLFEKFGFRQYATETVERQEVEFHRFLVELKLICD